MTCAGLEERRQVLIARADCETAADCAVIGSCGSAEWDAVRVEDRTEARAVRRAMDEAECIWAFDGEVPRPDCNAGRCKAVYTDVNGNLLEPACGQEPEDAGSDDAGGP